jgi:hypothetical protein
MLCDYLLTCAQCELHNQVRPHVFLGFYKTNLIHLIHFSVHFDALKSYTNIITKCNVHQESQLPAGFRPPVLPALRPPKPRAAKPASGELPIPIFWKYSNMAHLHTTLPQGKHLHRHPSRY